MSSIAEHTEASSSEAEVGRVRDDEHPSPRSEVVVASADTGTRPVTASASVMAAAEALLEYASVGRTDNDRESAQWGSAGQTEAIELGAAVGYSTMQRLSIGSMFACEQTELNQILAIL